MFKFCILSLLLCLLLPSHGTTSGTVVRVNQEALEYVCQTGRTPLQQAIRIIDVPDFTGRKGLFRSALNISGINILNVQLPRLSVKLVPQTGVQLSLSTDLRLRAQVLVPVELTVGSSIQLDIRVLRSAKGFPELSISACKSVLSDVQITLGILNMPNNFLMHLRNHLCAILVDKLCMSVSSVVLTLNGKLRTLVGYIKRVFLCRVPYAGLHPLDIICGPSNTGTTGLEIGINFASTFQVRRHKAINPVSQLQYSMIDPPVITKDYIDLDLNAAFALMGKPLEFSGPLPPLSLPPTLGSGHSMVNMGLSEDFLTTLFALLEQSGALNLDTAGQLNSTTDDFTTSLLGSAIPTLAHLFPKSVPVGMKVVVRKVPVVTLDEGRAILRLSLFVWLVAPVPACGLKPLFALDVDVSLALRLAVMKVNLQASVSLIGEVGLALAFSSVGPVDVSHVKYLIVPVFEKIFLDHLNATLSVGLTLPTLNNLEYVEPSVKIHKGYAVVNSGLSYRQ